MIIHFSFLKKWLKVKCIDVHENTIWLINNLWLKKQYDYNQYAVFTWKSKVYKWVTKVFISVCMFYSPGAVIFKCEYKIYY